MYMHKLFDIHPHIYFDNRIHDKLYGLTMTYHDFLLRFELVKTTEETREVLC
jgi:hypothetical protein